MSEQTEQSFESNVAEQRKKVALDLVGELQEMTQQRDELLTVCENAIKQMQDKPVQAQGEWEQGLMCGLEDMDLTDRYAACRHGYDKALDKVQEWIIDEIEAAIAKCR